MTPTHRRSWLGHAREKQSECGGLWGGVTPRSPQCSRTTKIPVDELVSVKLPMTEAAPRLAFVVMQLSHRLF